MSVFFDFLLPSAFDESNINTQINQSKRAFVKKKLLDTIKHPELAFDHLKAHLFLVEILTSREDLFLT